MMRIRTIGALAISGLALCSCGSTGGRSAALSRPPSRVNLSVYINNARVSVSPTSVGAGPVLFVVANQSSRSVSLAVSRGSRTLASTAPINPQATTQVTVDMTPGTYRVGPGARGRTEAQRSVPPSIAAASVRVGHRRRSGGMLQP